MSKIHCFKCLPSVFHVLAKCVHILYFQLCFVVKNHAAAPQTVYLMGMHSRDTHIQVGMVVECGLHGHIKSAVLGNNPPGLHVSVLGELFHIHSAELMNLAVIENAGLRGVALVADRPCNLEADGMFSALFVTCLGKLIPSAGFVAITLILTP